MQNKLLDYLKNQHQAIYLSLKIFKHRKNSARLKKIVDVDANSSFLCLECNPAAAISKVVFVVDICDEYGGFFSLLFRTLDGLYFCDYYQQEAVVKYADTVLYRDNSIVETDNVFEYYFQQPAAVLSKELENISLIARVTTQNFMFAHEVSNGQYFFSDEYLEKLSLVVKKNLRFNEKTESLIDEEIKRRTISSNTLGVHIRGSDYKNNFNNHPRFVPVEKYIEVIDSALKENNFSKIFLATDDVAILEKMIMYYGEEKLLYAKDIARIRGSEGIHTAEAQERESHQYLLGLEVLYDMCSLAECGGLISGLSYVSTFARVYKKSKGQLFLFDKTIDLGVNANRKLFENTVLHKK